MTQRFQRSEFHSMRLLVNVLYLEDAPFKIGVACLIGTVMGLADGSIASLRSLRSHQQPPDRKKQAVAHSQGSASHNA
jgi:hypothetical protein